MRVVLNRTALDQLLRSSNGPVSREIASYTRRTANRARQYVGVDSGRLRSSIQQTVNVEGTRVVGRVGSSVQYARYHHDGTGIYGPTGRPIRPVSAKKLAFRPKGSKTMIFTDQVTGSPPNPYLLKALRETVPWPIQNQAR